MAPIARISTRLQRRRGEHLTHRVTLKKLAPGTTYYYEVVSDQALGTGGKVESGVAQFTTKDKTQAAGK